MNDTQIHEHIEELVAEEHRLREHGDRGKLTTQDRERLDQISVRLDQYWDLLRQRRAREEFNEDPSTAHIRDEKTVEHYEQ